MSESPLRREPSVEPHGAPWLAGVGPTCGGEKRREANPASPGLGRRSASPLRPAKVCSGRMRLIPPHHSAWPKALMCPPLRAAHMSAYPPLGQAEANIFHPGKDGGPPSADCGCRVDRLSQPGRDRSASISHPKNKLKINNKKFLLPHSSREPADVTDEPVKFQK